MVKPSLRRLLPTTLACFLAGGAIAIPPAAAAEPPPAAPRVSIAVPARATSGVGLLATGRIVPADDPGKVQLQSRDSGSWKRLAGGAPRQGRYRIGFVLDVAGTVSVRAVLVADDRIVASSPARRVRVSEAEASAPSPSPSPAPTAGSQPPPAPTSPTTTAEPPVTVPGEPEEPPPVTDAYWGAWIGPQFTGTPAPEDMRAVTDFEALTDKPLSLLETFSQWATCSGAAVGCEPSVPFPRSQFEAIRNYGAIPLYSWATEGNGEPNAQPDFQLADIVAGKFDGYIRRWAEAAKAWGHPFFLRFDWEMNGTWFPWAEGVDGNQTGEYVTAWRHVHQIFSEVGATNASWVWCPYVNPNGNLQSAATLYPGDAYVDWTCLDGYNRGTTASPTAPYRSFDYLFGPTYREITGTVAPSKPMLLAEVAASEHGGSKARWIEEMFAELPTSYPQVRGLLWFDYYDQGNDWPIETSTAATEAFAAGVGDPRYLSNAFAATGSGPVPLP
jgi:mannan endo-1,4-beta-mannosidase